MANITDRSPMGLVDALCTRIEKAFSKSFWYPSEFDSEECLEPHVHAQYLPVSLTENPDRDKSKDYPIVQVILVDGAISDFANTAHGSAMKIQVYFGGYDNNPDNQGWRIPVAMMHAVLQDLLEDRLLGHYELTTPLAWSAINSKEPPYYWAMMETNWIGGPPAAAILGGNNRSVLQM